MSMIRWVRSRRTLAVIVAFAAALAAVITSPTAGLGRADVCDDAGGRYVQLGQCADLSVVVADTVPPTEYVAAQRKYAPRTPPGNIGHPVTNAQWSTTDCNGTLPQGLWDSGTVQYEVGNYMSDGLQIYGLICYPVSPGPPPVLMINHAVLFQGAVGLDTASFNGCIQMAAAGWFVATSACRVCSIVGTGSPGVTTFPPDPTFTRQSQGPFEFCGGEVDDSLNLLAAVKQLPEAKGNQVVMWGHSHGSCITKLAVERGAAPQIAVSLDGPTDFTTTTWPVLNAVFGAAWCDSCGTTDTDQLTARSSAWPGNTPTNLATAKFLRIQGEGDGIVIPQFGWEIAAEVGPASSIHFLSR